MQSAVQKAMNLTQLPLVVYAIMTLIAVCGKSSYADMDLCDVCYHLHAHHEHRP